MADDATYQLLVDWHHAVDAEPAKRWLATPVVREIRAEGVTTHRLDPVEASTADDANAQARAAGEKWIHAAQSAAG